MKFTLRSTEKSRFAAKIEWHPWFAWYPVLLQEGSDYSKKYAFAETIARRGIPKYLGSPYIISWEYKSLEDMV